MRWYNWLETLRGNAIVVFFWVGHCLGVPLEEMRETQKTSVRIIRVLPETRMAFLPNALKFVFKDWKTPKPWWGLQALVLRRRRISALGHSVGNVNERTEPSAPPLPHTHTRKWDSNSWTFIIRRLHVATEQLRELLNDELLYTEHADRHGAASWFYLCSVKRRRDCTSRTHLSPAGDVLEWRTLSLTSEHATTEIVVATKTTTYWGKREHLFVERCYLQEATIVGTTSNFQVFFVRTHEKESVLNKRNNTWSF